MPAKDSKESFLKTVARTHKNESLKVTTIYHSEIEKYGLDDVTVWRNKGRTESNLVMNCNTVQTIGHKREVCVLHENTLSGVESPAIFDCNKGLD